MFYSLVYLVQESKLIVYVQPNLISINFLRLTVKQMLLLLQAFFVYSQVHATAYEYYLWTCSTY